MVALRFGPGWERALWTDTPREATGCVKSISHRVKWLRTLFKRCKLDMICLLDAGNTLWTMFSCCLVEFHDLRLLRRAQRGAPR